MGAAGNSRRAGAWLAIGATGLAALGCGSQAASGTVSDQQAIKDREARQDAAADRVYRETEARKAEIARLRDEVARAKREQRAVAAQAGRGATEASRADATGGGTRSALLSAADRRSFARLEASLGGVSGVAVSGVGLDQPVTRAGSFQSAVAWSTSKVPVAMAAIAAGSAKQGPLTQAITASDNGAAETLWQGLGGGSKAASAATAQLRAAGDGTTEIQSRVLRSGFTAFGQTTWTLGNQVTFTAGLPCSPAGQQVLGLMSRTIPAQRWGLGATAWSASIKGGWGPGTSPGQGGGYIDRQMGILTSGGRQLAVTIMTRPSGGSHEAGTANLTRIARWVVAHVDRRALPSEASC